jgi:hypothetical protein
VFHVERPRFGRKQWCFRIQAGGNNLTPQANNAPHKPPKRVAIKLGARVIE